MAKKIRVIEHEEEAQTKEELGGKVRVAAYCRVSTIQEEQELSYESQCQYFKTLIEDNENMVLVGVFGDQGVSGLQAEKRPQLQSLMSHVRNDEVDLVLVKSISRMARNAIDLKEMMDEMKQHHTVIHFEREDIYSDDEQCELVVNLLASIAQEESNSLSQAMIWSNDRNNKMGKPTRKCPYGFRKKERLKRTDAHEWEVYEPEAEVVRLAFELAKGDLNYSGIARELEKKQKTIPEATQKSWSASRVSGLLKNEVYIGDLLTNKSYTRDYLTKTRSVNNGEREQYYLENHHPAIVSRDLFKEVNSIRNRRSA